MSDAKFRLRFFFDAGSGTCLWSDNPAARDRFDYAVDLSTLPVPENLWRQALYVTYWYDTSIDWNYPPDPSQWSAEESAGFHAAADALLARLREALGPDFELADERTPPHGGPSG